MSLTLRETCRGCGGVLEPFLFLGDQPLANRLRKPGEEGAQATYPLTLCRCRECDLVQLREVVDPALLFADYAYVPSTSSTMRAHFDELAGSITERFSLGPHHLVVDVGSNDGLLLSCFQRRGVRVLGIEPAENLAQRATANGIPTRSAFFGAEVARELSQESPAAVVTATNVFAHVDDVRAFLRAAFTLLAPDGVFVVEVQSLADTVSSLAFDMTYHEHMTYYATAPLQSLCEREGLALLDIERVDTHGGSLRAVIGRRGHPQARPARVAERIADERGRAGAAGCQRLALGAAAVREQLRTLLGDIRRRGGRVAAYGAPAKATVLLNYCELSGTDVEYVVDRNPAKQGQRIPGADIPVVGAEHLDAHPPTHLLLLAWNLAEEIMSEQESYRAGGGHFVVPVPVPRVVG
ncbi:MAG: class I SAM-dependent methyltransferase [Gemmatimonadaceae bacterium]